MTTDKYILDGHTAVVEPDLHKWAQWFETAARTVANDRVGAVRVSTVFLGLDHNYFATGRPLLFETMVFGGALDGEQDRYATWEEAEAGHTAMLARVTAA